MVDAPNTITTYTASVITLAKSSADHGIVSRSDERTAKNNTRRADDTYQQRKGHNVKDEAQIDPIDLRRRQT